MGFGSYDESEQDDASAEIDTEDSVDVHQVEHEGEVSFEADASNEELVDRLEEIKED